MTQNRVFVLSAASIRDRAMAAVGELPIGNPPLAVTVSAHKAKRTQSQNARYWAMLGVMAEHTGHEAEEIHDLMRAKFLEHREVTIGGQQYTILQSTTRLSTAAMAAYIERIEAWAYHEQIPVER